MSDVNTTTPSASDSKRKTVSKRDQIDANGNPVSKIEEATGARYTLLGLKGGNRDFDIQLGEAGKATTMFAIFGAWTKIGNVVNSVLNDKDDPGTPDEAAGEVEAFLALAEQGKWAERSATVGAKVDKALLAAIIAEWAAGQGKQVVAGEVEQKLIDAPALIAQYRKVPFIRDAYIERSGQGAVNEAALLDKLG